MKCKEKDIKFVITASLASTSSLVSILSIAPSSLLAPLAPRRKRAAMNCRLIMGGSDGILCKPARQINQMSIVDRFAPFFIAFIAVFVRFYGYGIK